MSHGLYSYRVKVEKSDMNDKQVRVRVELIIQILVLTHGGKLNGVCCSDCVFNSIKFLENVINFKLFYYIVYLSIYYQSDKFRYACFYRDSRDSELSCQCINA